MLPQELCNSSATWEGCGQTCQWVQADGECSPGGSRRGGMLRARKNVAEKVENGRPET